MSPQSISVTILVFSNHVSGTFSASENYATELLRHTKRYNTQPSLRIMELGKWRNTCTQINVIKNFRFTQGVIKNEENVEEIQFYLGQSEVLSPEILYFNKIIFEISVKNGKGWVSCSEENHSTQN